MTLKRKNRSEKKHGMESYSEGDYGGIHALSMFHHCTSFPDECETACDTNAMCELTDPTGETAGHTCTCNTGYVGTGEASGDGCTGNVNDCGRCEYTRTS